MDEEKLKFVERLKEVVSLLGYPERGRQTQLAKYYGVTQPSVSQWFDGSTMPSYAICVDLCKRAGVNYEWFMTGRGKKGYEDSVVQSDPQINIALQLLQSLPKSEKERAIKIIAAFTESSDDKKTGS